MYFPRDCPLDSFAHAFPVRRSAGVSFTKEWVGWKRFIGSFSSGRSFLPSTHLLGVGLKVVRGGGWLKLLSLLWLAMPLLNTCKANTSFRYEKAKVVVKGHWRTLYSSACQLIILGVLGLTTLDLLFNPVAVWYERKGRLFNYSKSVIVRQSMWLYLGLLKKYLKISYSADCIGILKEE